MKPGWDGAETSNEPQHVVRSSDRAQTALGLEPRLTIYCLGDPGQFNQSIRASISSSTEGG